MGSDTWGKCGVRVRQRRGRGQGGGVGGGLPAVTRSRIGTGLRGLRAVLTLTVESIPPSPSTGGRIAHLSTSRCVTQVVPCGMGSAGQAGSPVVAFRLQRRASAAA